MQDQNGRIPLHRRKMKKDLSLKKQRQVQKSLLALAKLIVDGSRGRREGDHSRHYCAICNMSWCLGYDGKPMFCHECPCLTEARKNTEGDFSNACIKTGQPKPCPICKPSTVKWRQNEDYHPMPVL